MFATVPAQACNWELKERSQAWVKRVIERALKLVERAILKWSGCLSVQPATNRSVALRPPKHGVRIIIPSPVLARRLETVAFARFLHVALLVSFAFVSGFPAFSLSLSLSLYLYAHPLTCVRSYIFLRGFSIPQV